MKRCRQCGEPYGGSPDGLCKNCRQLRDHPDKLSTRTSLPGKVIGSSAPNVAFDDMKQLDEPDRIKLIVGYLLQHRGKGVAVMVDTGPGHEDKGDRYTRAIREELPSVKLIRRTPGPVKNCETLVFKYEG